MTGRSVRILETDLSHGFVVSSDQPTGCTCELDCGKDCDVLYRKGFQDGTIISFCIPISDLFFPQDSQLPDRRCKVLKVIGYTVAGEYIDPDSTFVMGRVRIHGSAVGLFRVIYTGKDNVAVFVRIPQESSPRSRERSCWESSRAFHSRWRKRSRWKGRWSPEAEWSFYRSTPAPWDQSSSRGCTFAERS